MKGRRLDGEGGRIAGGGRERSSVVGTSRRGRDKDENKDSDEESGDSNKDDSLLKAEASNRLAKFQEMLMPEDRYVDVTQLREQARHGIPKQMRGEVWKYLIGVAPNENKEKHFQKDLKHSRDEDPATFQKIRRDVTKFIAKNPKLKSKVLDLQLGRLVRAHLHSRPSLEYRSGLVHIIGICSAVVDKQFEVYVMFRRILDLNTYYENPDDHDGKRLSVFLALLRRFLPSLANLFLKKGLSPNRWALLWIQDLLASSLPLKCTLRLWDTYLAEKDGWELHLYVCLAILAMCEEDLQELDGEELTWYLQHLPSFDMDLVLLRARNMRKEALLVPGRSRAVKKMKRQKS
mmetsp:Transcript_31022/g.43471  ORF Transcript_31022/g.43471 Transcript_31022/m.43471 type:complete len:347 (+) Transcript_31022:140-1180(+)